METKHLQTIVPSVADVDETILRQIRAVNRAPELLGWRLGRIVRGKRCVVGEAVAITDIAMEVVGGAAYFKTSPIERLYRDVRAGKFHPLTPEATQQLWQQLVDRTRSRASSLAEENGYAAIQLLLAWW